jgi:hypothetical protein
MPTPDEQILKLLKDWAPEVDNLLHQAGYFDLPRDSIKRQEIAKKIGLDTNGKLFNRVLKASMDKNEQISNIVLDEYSLRAFKSGAREVAKQLNIPFSKYDWNDGAQEHFQEHGLQLVKNMSQTDLDRLRDRIQYDFNLNPKDFAKKFADSYSCSPARLERIKRTEAHTESQAGSMNFAEQAECEYKQWMCHPRAIWPRPSHRAVWYEIRKMGEAFSNGLQFSGDPNCRCYLLYFLDKDHLKWGAKKAS